MAEKMNINEMRTVARENVMTIFSSTLKDCGAIQFADGSFAIKTTVNGQDIWVESTFRTKLWKPTKVAEAFDPEVERDIWQEEKRIKEEEAKEKKKG